MGGSAKVGAMVAGVSVLLFAVAVSGQSVTAIVVACPALDPAQNDELGARARLLIQASPDPVRPERVQLHCTPDQTTLYVDRTEPVPVDTYRGLIEGALDALEGELERRAAGRSPPKHLRQTAPAPSQVEDGLPALPPSLLPTEGATQRPPRGTDAGGLGVGVGFEPLPPPLDACIGPRLDIAVGVGQLAAIATESYRLGLGGGPKSELFSAQVGIAWGAPFDPESTFGVLTLVGWEWLALPRRDQTLRTPTVATGLRAAMNAGPVNVWVGVDGVMRLSPQRSVEPSLLTLERFSVLSSVGGFLLADRM